jgi:hypothetical protein
VVTCPDRWYIIIHDERRSGAVIISR